MEYVRLLVDAGSHERRFCPVHVDIEPPGGHEGLTASLVEDETETVVPSQLETLRDGTLRIHWIIKSIEKGKQKRYTIRFEDKPDETSDSSSLVEVKEEPDGSIGIYPGGMLFTRYHYKRDFVRPFLHPVLGLGGRSVTRNYPMVPDVPDETKDHPHHRSVWTAHGDVNGVDDWSEFPECGKIVHREFKRLMSGPVYGGFIALNNWVSNDGVKVVEEERRVKVYNTPDYARIMDVEVIFKATEGDVTFGDTKEGGILSVRVASSMDVVRGGRIENSYGAINEEEAWGRRAQWCDYSGPVKGLWVGLAIFDHPKNLRHPTYWHARNYGLMTANPFGISYFTGGPKKIGDYRLEAGGTLHFRYRLFIHKGNVEEGGVREAYHNYVNPPRVTVKGS